MSTGNSTTYAFEMVVARSSASHTMARTAADSRFAENTMTQLSRKASSPVKATDPSTGDTMPIMMMHKSGFQNCPRTLR